MRPRDPSVAAAPVEVDVDALPEPHGSAYREVMAGRDGPRINIHGTVGHSPSVLVRFVEA